MGDGSGATLALLTLFRIRDHHLPQPACAVLMSPYTLLNAEAKSYRDNKDKDFILCHDFKTWSSFVTKTDVNQLYLLGHAKYSPLYDHLYTLPPLLIHSGGHEVLAAECYALGRLARSNGVKVTVVVGCGCGYGCGCGLVLLCQIFLSKSWRMSWVSSLVYVVCRRSCMCDKHSLIELDS